MNTTGYRIESTPALSSDWLPLAAFTTIYDNQSVAVATAIEGVDDPGEREVCVIDVATGDVVWRSTDEEYE
jgi:hypothetical protein